MVEDEDTAPIQKWILLICATLISFWAQAAVTEERFVPSLNVIAKYLKLSDDVAGATLMAAGASSPELFSAFVALFITHTTLGLGTIIGSEVFNQLIICAGSVNAAKDNKLYLDKDILFREVGFYSLSIILLVWAVHDRKPLVSDDDRVHIYVSFTEALVLLATYILYVWVCANFSTVLSWFKPKKSEYIAADSKVSYGSSDTTKHRLLANIDSTNTSFIRMLEHEPKNNFKDHEDEFTGKIDSSGPVFANRSSTLWQMMSQSGSSLRHFSVRSTSHNFSGDHNIGEVIYEGNKANFFLYQRSTFYDKSKISMNSWYLRWITIEGSTISSVPSRDNAGLHKKIYSGFDAVVADEDHRIIILTKVDGTDAIYTFMAPTKEIYDLVEHKFSAIAKEQVNLEDSPNVGFEGDEPAIIDFPESASIVGIFFHYILFPFKALIHFTLPDVRLYESDPKKMLFMSWITIVGCLGWLITMSYVMVRSLEMLGALMHIPNAIMGVTFSAAGTSLPNYVASQVAASQGFGNQAVSNAFGSNIFNILVGLGLPWILYITFVTHFQSYHDMADDGIISAVFILAIVLLIFVVLTLSSNYVLLGWHGKVYAFMYLLYVMYEIGQVLV